MNGKAEATLPFRNAPRALRGANTAATERRQAYLHAGQLLVSAEPCRITTILGSCIAVCLWDPAVHVGGLTHFILPNWAGEGISSPKFGNVAIETLRSDLVRLGGRLLRARVYGGACLSDALNGGKTIAAGATHLGQRNADFALEFLASLRIPVVEHNTGGSRGRKLIFHTDTGESWLHML
jgi:chemotaxis protein CheD